VNENKLRAVKAGIMKVLVKLMANFKSNMVDKSAYVLVEIVEVRTQRQKKIVVFILLQVCEDKNPTETLTLQSARGKLPLAVSLLRETLPSRTSEQGPKISKFQ